MRGNIVLGILLALAAAACTDDAAISEEPETSTTTSAAPTTTTSTAASVAPTTTTSTAVAVAVTTTVAQAETDRVIQAWIEGRAFGDPWDFASLYTYNGTYQDLACRFEANGRWAIQTMIGRHRSSADYTAVDAITVTYTESGAVVEWIWSGTYDGTPFTLDPTTTFRIEDGLILISTDSYDRADVPPHWLGDCALYPAP